MVDGLNTSLIIIAVLSVIVIIVHCPANNSGTKCLTVRSGI